ncbi:2600_t:CDS:2, partial [Racocetra fulgida]
AMAVSDSEHSSNGSDVDERIPKYQAQVIITTEPFTLHESESLSENSDSDQQNEHAKDEKDMYQPTSSEEEDEGFSDSSEEYSPKRRLPQRHVTSKKINYSDEKYYKKVHKIFDDFYEVLSSSEEESTSRKQKKLNDDDPLRPKRRPRRKSAKKSVDYDEKGYYKKFETALNARIH